MTSNKTTYAVVLGIVFMMVPFAIDLYLPAFPAMAASFNTGFDEIEATVAIFLGGFALGQLILGPLSDTFGRRIVLLGGMLVFVLASAFASLAESISAFYFWRFLQALGGAGAVAVFPAVRDRFSEQESTRIFSYIMAIILVAPVIAPVLGGYILLVADWRTIFHVIAGLGLITLIAVAVSIQDFRTVRPALSLRSIAAGYKAVLTQPRIVFCILAGSFALAGLFAFIAGSPFVYIDYFGVAPEHYGYIVGLNALAMISINLINGKFLVNTDPVKKTIWGAIFVAIAGLAMLLVSITGLGLAPLVATVVLFFAAMALTETNAFIVALSVLPEENGTVAALFGAGQFGIGALASFLVSYVESTDPFAMTSIMAGSAIAVLVSALLLRRHR